jgi:hypothetical protein
MIEKLLGWGKLNIASVLGFAQAVIKAVKEILTGVINLLSLFAPAKLAQLAVIKLRDFLNVLDAQIETLKATLVAHVDK